MVATVSPSATLPQNQPNCLIDAATGLVDCGNWAVSASWAVPATATSGIYFAKVARTDTGGASHIVFVVRDDERRSDLLFQTSDTTWQAYNQYGGNSLYVGNPAGRAYKVSYNRPFTIRGTTPEDWVFNAEYPMVRWLESNGYNVSYSPASTPIGSARRNSRAQGVPVCRARRVLVGRAADQRRDGARRRRQPGVLQRQRGVLEDAVGEQHLGAGDAVPDARRPTRKRTRTPRSTRTGWTGTWRDPRFSPPADGGRPENALTGTLFTVNSGTSAIRAFRRRRHALLAEHRPSPARARHVCDMPFGTLGYEWDEDLDNGFRPPGLIRLSDTTVSGVDYLQDHGSDVRVRHGQPRTDALSPLERRARLRRRHDSVVVGARQHSRSRLGSTEPGDAAGHGESVCRHGHPADDAAARHRADVRDASSDTVGAQLDDHVTAHNGASSGQRDRRRSPARRPTPAAGSSVASKSRSTAAQRGAARRPCDLEVLLADGAGRTGAPFPGRRRQRESRGPSPASPSPSVLARRHAPARCGRRPKGRPGRLSTTEARWSSAPDSAPTWRIRHGHPFLQAVAEYGHSHGQPLDRRREPFVDRNLHR